MAPYVDDMILIPQSRVFLVAAEAQLFIRGEDPSEESEFVKAVPYVDVVEAISEDHVKVIARLQLLSAIVAEIGEFDSIDILFSEIKEISREQLKKAASRARSLKEIERLKK